MKFSTVYPPKTITINLEKLQNLRATIITSFTVQKKKKLSGELILWDVTFVLLGRASPGSNNKKTRKISPCTQPQDWPCRTLYSEQDLAGWKMTQWADFSQRWKKNQQREWEISIIPQRLMTNRVSCFKVQGFSLIVGDSWLFRCVFRYEIVRSQNLIEGLYFGIYILGADLHTNTDTAIGSQQNLPCRNNLAGTFRQLL